jgi:hypothetical protein
MNFLASLIDDEPPTPQWKQHLCKLNPFKRRKVVAIEDVVPLLDALENIEAQGRPHSRACGCGECENWDQVYTAYTKFILKHPLP